MKTFNITEIVRLCGRLSWLFFVLVYLGNSYAQETTSILETKPKDFPPNKEVVELDDDTPLSQLRALMDVFDIFVSWEAHPQEKAKHNHVVEAVTEGGVDRQLWLIPGFQITRSTTLREALDEFCIATGNSYIYDVIFNQICVIPAEKGTALPTVLDLPVSLSNTNATTESAFSELVRVYNSRHPDIEILAFNVTDLHGYEMPTPYSEAAIVDLEVQELPLRTALCRLMNASPVRLSFTFQAVDSSEEVQYTHRLMITTNYRRPGEMIKPEYAQSASGEPEEGGKAAEEQGAIVTIRGDGPSGTTAPAPNTYTVELSDPPATMIVRAIQQEPDVPFDRWRGDIISTDDTIVLTLDSDKTITAQFVRVKDESIRVSYKSFIAPPFVATRFICGEGQSKRAVVAEGDNRGFDSDLSASSRKSSSVELRPILRAVTEDLWETNDLTMDVGLTRHYADNAISDNAISQAARDDTVLDDCDLKICDGYASTDTTFYTLESVSEEEAVVRFWGSGENPCAPEECRTNYDFSIRIIWKRTLGRLTWRVEGMHDPSPWHEIYIDDDAAYQYEPSGGEIELCPSSSEPVSASAIGAVQR